MRGDVGMGTYYDRSEVPRYSMSANYSNADSVDKCDNTRIMQGMESIRCTLNIQCFCYLQATRSMDDWPPEGHPD